MKKKIFYYFFIFFVSALYCSNIDDIIDKTIRYNNWNDAKIELEKYLETNGDDTKALKLYAEVLNNLKLYDDAILTIRKAINFEKNNKNKSELYFNLGNYYFNKKLNDTALKMYDQAIEYNKSLASAYYMKGVIYLSKDEMDPLISNWKNYIIYTDNIDKKIKIEQIISRLEQQILDNKLKEEEQKRLREEFINQLKQELENEDANSKSLEADKNKTTKSEEDFEELD
jgi:tetratricopeptide (TPR) repeat protein